MGCVSEVWVERVGMLFWEVKSAVIGLKQEGPHTWSLSFD